MKIDSNTPAEERKRWCIVRTDTFIEMPGVIGDADEITGDCTLTVKGGPAGETTTTHHLGAGGIRIVRRRR
jgi:hypothetical protein